MMTTPEDDAPMPEGAAPTQPQEKADPVVFKPPGAFKPPEAGGKKRWSLVCEFETQADGSVALVKLGETDIPLPEAKAKAKAPPKSGNEGIDELAESLSQPDRGARGAA